MKRIKNVLVARFDRQMKSIDLMDKFDGFEGDAKFDTLYLKGFIQHYENGIIYLIGLLIQRRTDSDKSYNDRFPLTFTELKTDYCRYDFNQDGKLPPLLHDLYKGFIKVRNEMPRVAVLAETQVMYDYYFKTPYRLIALSSAGREYTNFGDLWPGYMIVGARYENFTPWL